jgi:hypothetical protein
MQAVSLQQTTGFAIYYAKEKTEVLPRKEPFVSPIFFHTLQKDLNPAIIEPSQAMMGDNEND